MEVAGVMEAAPPGSGLSVGQRVYASLPVGGCAETVWAREHLAAPLPDSLSAAQGQPWS
jgi:NADPH2:quinone reductase